MANGGNLKDATIAGARSYATSYISANVANYIGESINSSNQLFTSSVAHGALGGVMGELNGGKFGHGFASSFLSKYIGTSLNLADSIPGNEFSAKFTRTMIAGIIGGGISEATGGKFANGAAQSAIQWAFNAESGTSNDTASDDDIVKSVTFGFKTKLSKRLEGDLSVDESGNIDAKISGKGINISENVNLKGEVEVSSTVWDKVKELFSSPVRVNKNGFMVIGKSVGGVGLEVELDPAAAVKNIPAVKKLINANHRRECAAGTKIVGC